MKNIFVYSRIHFTYYMIIVILTFTYIYGKIFMFRAFCPIYVKQPLRTEEKRRLLAPGPKG